MRLGSSSSAARPWSPAPPAGSARRSPTGWPAAAATWSCSTATRRLDAVAAASAPRTPTGSVTDLRGRPGRRRRHRAGGRGDRRGAPGAPAAGQQRRGGAGRPVRPGDPGRVQLGRSTSTSGPWSQLTHALLPDPAGRPGRAPGQRLQPLRDHRPGRADRLLGQQVRRPRLHRGAARSWPARVGVTCVHPGGIRTRIARTPGWAPACPPGSSRPAPPAVRAAADHRPRPTGRRGDPAGRAPPPGPGPRHARGRGRGPGREAGPRAPRRPARRGHPGDDAGDQPALSAATGLSRPRPPPGRRRSRWCERTAVPRAARSAATADPHAVGPLLTALQVIQQHGDGQHRGRRIGLVLPGDVRRRAVHRFEDRWASARVGSMLPLAAMPIPPLMAPARSVTTSPNRLSVTITSYRPGLGHQDRWWPRRRGGGHRDVGELDGDPIEGPLPQLSPACIRTLFLCTSVRCLRGPVPGAPEKAARTTRSTPNAVFTLSWVATSSGVPCRSTPPGPGYGPSVPSRYDEESMSAGSTPPSGVATPG